MSLERTKQVKRHVGAHRGLLVVAGLGTALLGFSTPALYPEPVQSGGGGGRFFTGSHRDAFGCGVCHDSVGALDVEIRGVPTHYEAGITYTVDLSWPTTQATVSVVTEWVDASGEGIGELVLPPEDILEPSERCASGSRAAQLYTTEEFARTIVGMPACGATQLRVQWTAPDDPEIGSAWFHVGAVASDDSDDPSGDRVLMQTLRVDSSAPETSGCRMSGTPSSCPAMLVLLLALRRRRRA